MTIIDARRELSIMESVNRFIDDLHRSLGLADTDFFCECGRIGCMERITLTRAEYKGLRAAERPVLAAVHLHREQRGRVGLYLGPANGNASSLLGGVADSA